MLATIDLTQRQAARVLAQALHTRAALELEPRGREGAVPGAFAGRQENLLCVELSGSGAPWPPPSLIGAFCDVRMVLTGNMYLFATCVVDVTDDTPSQRLLLALPETIQVANRRRFDRKSAGESVALQLSPAEGDRSFAGTLTSISLGGLGCRVPRQAVESLLLIDDPVRVQFRLPESPELFEIDAVVCVKTPARDGGQLEVGLEFALPRPGQPPQPALDRLRLVLLQYYAGPARGEDQA